MKKKTLRAAGPKKFKHPDLVGFFCVAIGVVLFFSLISFHHGYLNANWLGALGYSLAFCLEYALGLAAYLIPGYCFFLGGQLLSSKFSPMRASQHSTFGILLFSASLLLNVYSECQPNRALQFHDRVIIENVMLSAPYPHTVTRTNLGGVPSYFLLVDLPIFNLQRVLSLVGVTLIFSSLGIISFLMITRIPLVKHLLLLSRAVLALTRSWIAAWNTKRPPANSPKPKIVYSGLQPEPKREKPPKEMIITPKEIVKEPIPKQKSLPAQALPPSLLPMKCDGSYHLPSPQLLSNPVHKVDQPTLKKDLRRQSEILEETLKSFGIEAKVGAIHSGPTITSFEVHPSIGVKVQKIKALENDIALNMQAKSIRIVAPIPGKAAVGVEVPAVHPQEVSFKELLLHYHQNKRKLQIPILLGKGVSGEPVFSDLTKMPHLLIAGATGSGKSVCINTIVLSILMNARPEEVRLLMVDPKKVELTQYSQLPHMIAPVITEPHGAYAALQWLVKEMQLRYEILKQLGLRNISAFNSRKINAEFEQSLGIQVPEHLPLIVAMIDEFADLMMVSSADIETPIARIAQMARAVGIHLILATQRPSREVITGIIKANIPCRIAFKVASRINSQIILDDTGAESLLGNGDCLFMPPGSSQLVRAQGAYVSDEEINDVIQHVQKQAPTSYLIPSFDAFRSLEQESEEGPKGKDALYEQALLLVTQTKVASTTYLQRKLKIGYARAASLMDELEENGIIGPQDGSKPRRVIGTSSLLDET
jgi:DNA segregation ATPase FtsK/SpoIIIE, S-DNA-T family